MAFSTTRRLRVLITEGGRLVSDGSSTLYLSAWPPVVCVLITQEYSATKKRAFSFLLKLIPLSVSSHGVDPSIIRSGNTSSHSLCAGHFTQMTYFNPRQPCPIRQIQKFPYLKVEETEARV